MPSPCPGPGDRYLAAIERDEHRHEQWLREASDRELVDAGICPTCRGRDCAQGKPCQSCFDGHVLRCEACGCAIRPGDEQVLPVFVDRPNGPTTTMCRRCAEAGA
jgi:hypothetical protein